jgi:hypothetical protein
MVWNKKFDAFLADNLTIKRIQANPCIYILRDGPKIVILGVHVDDTLMVHNDETLAIELSASFKTGSKLLISIINLLESIIQAK